MKKRRKPTLPTVLEYKSCVHAPAWLCGRVLVVSGERTDRGRRMKLVAHGDGWHSEPLVLGAGADMPRGLSELLQRLTMRGATLQLGPSRPRNAGVPLEASVSRAAGGLAVALSAPRRRCARARARACTTSRPWGVALPLVAAVEAASPLRGRRRRPQRLPVPTR